MEKLDLNLTQEKMDKNKLYFSHVQFFLMTFLIYGKFIFYSNCTKLR